jgi:hypothetical protein
VYTNCLCHGVAAVSNTSHSSTQTHVNEFFKSMQPKWTVFVTLEGGSAAKVAGHTTHKVLAAAAAVPVWSTVLPRWSRQGFMHS